MDKITKIDSTKISVIKDVLLNLEEEEAKLEILEREVLICLDTEETVKKNTQDKIAERDYQINIVKGFK